SIVIWNRTDCCAPRLTNFRVSILDGGFGEVFSEEFFIDGLGFPDTTAAGFDIPVDDATGQYVRVELFDTHPTFNPAEYVLSLAEVQVFSDDDGIAPLILSQPSSAQVIAGDTFELSVEAEGSAPLSYQWYRDDAEIAGATSATLLFDPVEASDEGTYKVVVSNGGGVAESDPIELIVFEFPNLAVHGTASQSTTGFGGTPERGIDGNTDGIFNNGSVTHTNTGDPTPWWEVALPGNTTIHDIVVWNRTDPCCPQRLTNFRVLIFDADRPEVCSGDF